MRKKLGVDLLVGVSYSGDTHSWILFGPHSSAFLVPSNVAIELVKSPNNKIKTNKKKKK